HSPYFQDSSARASADRGSETVFCRRKSENGGTEGSFSERGHFGAAKQIPKLERAAHAAGNHEASVWRDSQSVNRVGLLGKRERRVALRLVPEIAPLPLAEVWLTLGFGLWDLGVQVRSLPVQQIYYPTVVIGRQGLGHQVHVGIVSPPQRRQFLQLRAAALFGFRLLRLFRGLAQAALLVLGPGGPKGL